MSWRRALTIASWEVRRGAAAIDRRTLAVAVLVVLIAGALTPVAISAGGSPDRGIYRVALDEDSRYGGPVAVADSLRPVEPYAELGVSADVRIVDGTVRYADSPKGRAALAALRDAVAAYNDRLLARGEDSAAAFPVRVTLRYASQEIALAPGGDTGAEPGEPTQAPDTTNDGDSGGGDSPDGETPGGDGTDDGSDSGTGSALLGGIQRDTPGGLTAPFPVRSLILAFLFVLPLNVVIQAFGSSVMAERLKRRGEALLVAPVSRYVVVAGKTLPYFLAAIGVSVLIALLVGGGLLSIVAVAPLAGLFLAATFVAAMFARSYKELTFLTVTISVGVTSFAFVPAIFSQITPVAAISPLSLVVYDLTGEPVSWATVVLGILPVSLVAGVLFALGVGVFREEDMFTQRRVPAKVLDAFAAQLPSRRRVALWSALLVPFAFVAELFGVAALFAVRAPVTIPLLLVVVAVVEEFTKSVHVLAGFRRARFPSTDRSAVVVGVLSGVGFAIAEKLVLLVQAVGLSEYLLARAAFAPAGVSDPLLVAALLLAPFGLHILTATVSALGARRSDAHYVGAYGLAVILHLVYNLVVVSAVA